MKLLLTSILIIVFCQLSFAQNDSIVLSNNDKLIGEIKSLEKGVLYMKTPYSDSDFKIKWHRVKELYSNRLYIIELSNGSRLHASIKTDSIDKKDVILNNYIYSDKTELKRVIFLDPVGKSWIGRLNAEFDFGFTLTKANNSQQINSSGLIGYIANKWSAKTTFSSVYSSQDNTEDIKRIETDVNFTWFLPKEWFISATTNFLSNNEQKLKLRTTGRIGPGYFFRKNNDLFFAVAFGLAYNNEEYTDATLTSKSSLEGYVGTEFNKYDIGDFSTMSSIYIYPSITERGRLRSDLNIDLKYDLPLDFYLKSGISYNYDNQPAEGASEGDYVIKFSFGWELK